jgi:hypothetical protein
MEIGFYSGCDVERSFSGMDSGSAVFSAVALEWMRILGRLIFLAAP